MIQCFCFVPAGKRNRRELLRGNDDGGVLHGVEVGEVFGPSVARGAQQTRTGREEQEPRRNS